MPSAPPASTIDLAVLGTVVRVGVEDPADEEVLRDLWHLCALPSPTEDLPDSRAVRLPATSGEAARGWALTTLTQEVTRAGIAARSGSQLMLHAGGLSDLATGATVVYVAPGGTGKTTITATLGRGRGYITDETVAVSATGGIEPYPKPLSVRQPVGGKTEVAPRDLGLHPASASPWLAGLLLVRRDPEHAGAPAVRELGLLDAIAAISPETSALAALPRPLQTCRELIELAGGVRHVTFREAPQLEDLVTDVLARERS